jgi:hypothetical protein
MIIKTFDRGWGTEWPWKKFELEHLITLLEPVIRDSSRTVVINSVWYTDQVDQEVRAWLSHNDWDRLILVAMLDCAIPRPEQFEEFGRPVMTVGYYPGDNSVDLCAMFLWDRIDLEPYGNLLDPSRITVPYMCLNRKPHWHRRKLYRQLETFDLLNKGLVTMGSDGEHPARTMPHDVAADMVGPNSDTAHYGIPNNVCSLGPPQHWQSCFFNVVTETNWDINQSYFVSEKIYKPILGMRPFTVYDPDGGRSWLHARGFETFERDFSDISDHDPSDANQLAYFLRDLCAESAEYFQYKFHTLVPKLRHNQDNFRTYIQNQHRQIHAGLRIA